MKWLFLLLFNAFFCICRGQEISDISAQKLENETAGADDREPEDDAQYQQLEFYARHKVNINTVAPEWLGQVLGLSVMQVQQFEAYRKWLGPFADLVEIQAIPGWDVETIRRVIPFLKMEQAQQVLPVLKERFTKGEHSFLLRTGRVLEKSMGFQANDSGAIPFTGDRQRLMLRYMYRFRNLLQWGITMEKDPGEPLLKKGYRKGFDFYSFHFSIHDFRFIKALVLGDFHINLGQGLIHWQSMAFGKSAETAQVLRQGHSLRAYNSTDENRFHRGAGMAIEKKEWSLLLFLARDKLDGNITPDTSSQSKKVLTSFQTSGLHRTLAELQDKDAFRQSSLGGRLGFKKGTFKIALNGIRFQFSEDIRKKKEPYNLYAINGRNWSNYSIDHGFNWKSLYFFGEVAGDQKGHYAIVQGLLASLHPALDISCVYRNISKAYRALQVNAFAENREAQNENGFYTGITFRPKSSWRLDAYFDFFRFPWLAFQVDRPTDGFGQLAQLSWKPHKKMETYIRFQKEVKSANKSGGVLNMNELVTVARTNLRWQCAFQPFADLTIRNRLELNWNKNAGNLEQGFLVYLDFIYKSLRRPYSVSTRLAWFQTDGYNSRIYGFEQDVLYYYAISSLFDSGARGYILCHYKIHKNWDAWCKFSSTWYMDKHSIGSGLGEILNDHRSELRLQLQYRF